MKLTDCINICGGRLVKDGEFEVLEYCTAEVDKKFLSFIEREKFISKISQNVSCVLCTEELVACLPDFIEGICVVEEPKKMFVTLHNELAKSEAYAGPRKPTRIGENCDISDLACIAKENVTIGNNVTIEPFVVINSNVEIGDNCIIRSGTTIGGKGFNFVKTADGEMLGMRDLGRVVLGSNVEICSNCHVANGPLPTDVTRLDDHVKMDVFAQIGHGSRVGRRTLIASGAQISGNVVIEEDCWIGVNATISNRIHIGDNARINLGAVVTKNVEAGTAVSGNFAIDHGRFLSHIKELSKKEV